MGEEDAKLEKNKWNFWLAQDKKTTGQGFTLKVDNCSRLIAGCQIKNKGEGMFGTRGTKEFQVMGSVNENGPWVTLVKR